MTVTICKIDLLEYFSIYECYVQFSRSLLELLAYISKYWTDCCSDNSTANDKLFSRQR